MRPPAWTILLLAIATALGMAGCATPFTKAQTLPPHYQLGVAEGVRLAAQAAQAVGYLPSIQNEAAGFMTAERQRTDAFNLDMFTLYLNVRFARDAAGSLKVDATCAVSQNIAYTDELDDECEKFYAAFNRLVEERGTRRAAPAAALPGRMPQATPPQPQGQPKPPAPPQPKPQPAQREYQL